MSPVKHLRLKRFLAKYVKYVTWGGYGLVIVVVATVVALCFVKINLYCNSNATVAGLLKPLEGAVTPTSDTVVLRFLVKDGDEVATGQPLVEYCDDPAWVARMRAARDLAALAEDLERGGVGLPNGFSAAQARAQVESLESLRSSPPFRKTFDAPGPGVVLMAETAAEPVIAGGSPLMGVHDLDDLRLTTTMVGANVNNCAVGREVLLETRNQNHSDKLVLQVEAEGEPPPAWPELRFNNLGGTLVARKIGEALKGYSIFVEDDDSKVPVPYSFDTVKVGTFRATGRSGRDGEPRDTSVSAQTDLVNGREFRARVISGDPLCEITFTDLPEDARKTVENAIEALNLQWRFDGQAYEVSDLRDMTFLLTVNTKASPNDADWTKFNASRTAEGRPSNRRFIATLQLVSPPPELKAAVKELLLKKPPVFLDMKARVIATQVGLATLLFSQE